MAGTLWAAEPTGTITGRVAGTATDVRLSVVRPGGGRTYAGTFDPATRRFQIGGLPLDQDLDCILEIAGARLQGVNFGVPRSDYETEQPLSPADAQVIRERTRAMNRFEDQVEILAVDGNIQHAAVLVHKLRTQPFVNSRPGEVIWRVELWHYERPEDDWVRTQEDFGVLYRERLQRLEFEKKSITFDPALGGLRLTAARPTLDLGEIRPPPAKPGIRCRDGRNK